MKQSDSYEWVKIDEKKKLALVGITKEASRELGEIVFVELPSVGDQLKAGDEAAVLESTKAAADSYAPLAGKVTRVNESLVKDPSLVVKDPHGNGWLYEIELDNAEEYDRLSDYRCKM